MMPRRAIAAACGLTLGLAGCGITHTTTTSLAAPHNTRRIVIDLAGLSVSVHVPSSWPLRFVQPGAGDGIDVGSDRQEIILVRGNPEHWHPTKRTQSQTYHGQFTLYRELHGADYVAVTVPNTAASRKMAHRIVASIKLQSKGGAS